MPMKQIDLNFIYKQISKFFCVFTWHFLEENTILYLKQIVIKYRKITNIEYFVFPLELAICKIL